MNTLPAVRHYLHLTGALLVDFDAFKLVLGMITTTDKSLPIIETFAYRSNITQHIKVP